MKREGHCQEIVVRLLQDDAFRSSSNILNPHAGALFLEQKVDDDVPLHLVVIQGDLAGTD